MVESFIDFSVNNFFLISKLLISAGIILCIYAVQTKKENNRKISNDVAKDNTAIRDKNIENSKKKTSKNTGIIMGLGVTAVVVGVILLVIVVIAIIMAIYFFMFIASLD